MKNLERKVLLGILLGILVYAALAVWGEAGSLGRQVASFQWWFFFAALGLAFCNYLMRFAKWQYYLRLLRIDVPRRESFLVFLSSLMLTITPGKIGEVLKSYLLKRSRGVSISVTAPIVVAERLTDLLALICLALVGISTYHYGWKALLVTGGLVTSVLVAMSVPRIALGLIGLLSRMPLVGRLAPKFQVAYQSMRLMVTPRPLFWCTFLSVLAWALECIAFYLVIGGFQGSDAALLPATFLYAFTTILGAISFLPGGLGVTEGSMSVGLVELGLLATTAKAIAATVIIRLATLWFAVVVGLLAFLSYRRSWNRDGKTVPGANAEDPARPLEGTRDPEDQGEGRSRMRG